MKNRDIMMLDLSRREDLLRCWLCHDLGTTVTHVRPNVKEIIIMYKGNVNIRWGRTYRHVTIHEILVCSNIFISNAYHVIYLFTSNSLVDLKKGKRDEEKKEEEEKKGKQSTRFLSLSSILATVLTYRCRAHGTRLCEIVTRPGVGENAFRRNPRRMVFGVIFQNNTRVLARGPV